MIEDTIIYIISIPYHVLIWGMFFIPILTAMFFVLKSVAVIYKLIKDCRKAAKNA